MAPYLCGISLCESSSVRSEGSGLAVDYVVSVSPTKGAGKLATWKFRYFLCSLSYDDKEGVSCSTFAEKAALASFAFEGFRRSPGKNKSSISGEFCELPLKISSMAYSAPGGREHAGPAPR